MSRSSLVVLGFAALFAVIVLLNARKSRTSERHTFAWLLVSAAVAGLAVWRAAIDELAAAMGIYYAPSALFFLCLGALLWIVFRLSLDVGEQKQRVRKLAQEIAILTSSNPAASDAEKAPRPE